MVANGAKLDINISATCSPAIGHFLTKALLFQKCLDPKMGGIEEDLKIFLRDLTPDMLEVFQERLEVYYSEITTSLSPKNFFL
ncbi:MAG UNVERIFIED_CONTAM: hypothetical protein LVQ98_07595 [Rickettsiaceae bacterium]